MLTPLPGEEGHCSVYHKCLLCTRSSQEARDTVLKNMANVHGSRVLEDRKHEG